MKESRFKGIFGSLTEDLVNIIFPNLCAVCGKVLVKGENVLCLDCLLSLPRTNLHKIQPNIIHERVFSFGCPVERASSLYYYHRDNKYAKLIHDTKYRDRPSVGQHLASLHARELKAAGFFEGIDAIVPVPLHFIKRLQRGYNQAEEIGKALALVTGLPVVNALRASYHRSQTRKDAHARLVNTTGVYHVRKSDEIEGRHVLLVDDVITTGATLLNCIKAIKKSSPSTKVSVYSLAITQLL